MMEALQGKKTYAAAAVGILVNVLAMFDIVIPEDALVPINAALGFVVAWFLRAGIKKSET